MLPSREEAEKILQECELINPGPWGNHCRVAAHCAEKIAKACGDIDSDKAYIVCLLHDIGRRFGGRHLGHVSDGYTYMSSLGYDEVAQICLTHSFSNKKIDEYIGKVDTTEEETQLVKEKLAEVTYDDFDRLGQLCDALAGPDRVLDMEARMEDVKSRYGYYPEEKWAASKGLRKYFEEKMGRDIYEVVEKDTFRIFLDENSRIWDERSENNDKWSQPVDSETIERARKGEWTIVLTPRKSIPKAWFPDELAGKKVLCLAGGGGQQGPILAAAGAEVTVFDNSKKQLEKDEFVAQRDHLMIKTVQGNMQDLSAFSDASFDLIVHPWSNGYIDNVLPVWKECSRVLKKGGLLLAGFGNPIEGIFNVGKLEQGIMEVTNKIPYADIEHMYDFETKKIVDESGYIWCHTLEDQIQGQIAAGFAIVGFYEDTAGTVLDQYINSSIATKAIKL